MSEKQLTAEQKKRIDELMEQWKEEVRQIPDINTEAKVFSNILNKPYWDLQAKYMPLIEAIKNE